MPQVQGTTTATAVKTFFFFLISYFYFLQVDKTKTCTSKVVDLLIKLIVWPYYASWIRRGSWRAVVSSTLCIKWHFTRLERQCIFETESQDIRILSFLLILGNYWRLMRSFFDHEPQITVSSTTPKWKIQPNTQTTIDGKDDDFIRDIISPCGVKKTDKTQAISEFAHSSPSFYECFSFFDISLPWGVTARLQPQESSPTFDKVSELE